ncbi:hypothetical protein K070079E91_51690 [Eisenbergiella porci]
MEWLGAGISMYPEGQNENIDIEWIAEEKRRYGQSDPYIFRGA